MTKKKQWEAHPWNRWAQKLLVKRKTSLCLYRGKDYSCTTRAMIVQAYAFFSKTTLKISIKDLSTDPEIDGISLTLMGRRLLKTTKKKKSK